MYIQKFFDKKFGEIRGLKINNKTYLFAKDVAKCLGYKNPNEAIRDHVRNKYIKHSDSLCLPGRPPMLISEPGIYQLIFSSKMPDAEAFQDWVFEEVLPNIREHGMYIDSTHDIVRKVTKLHNKYLRSLLFCLYWYNVRYNEQSNDNSNLNDKGSATFLTAYIQNIIDSGCGIDPHERDGANIKNITLLMLAEMEAIYIIAKGFYENSNPIDIQKQLECLENKYRNLRNDNVFIEGDFIG